MKFYNKKKWSEIMECKLTAIYRNNIYIAFFKKGYSHNIKNASIIYTDNSGYNEFRLNDNLYGYENKFTKESWRRFVKLKAFL